MGAPGEGVIGGGVWMIWGLSGFMRTMKLLFRLVGLVREEGRRSSFGIYGRAMEVD